MNYRTTLRVKEGKNIFLKINYWPLSVNILCLYNIFIKNYFHMEKLFGNAVESEKFT